MPDPRTPVRTNRAVTIGRIVITSLVIGPRRPTIHPSRAVPRARLISFNDLTRDTPITFTAEQLLPTLLAFNAASQRGASALRRAAAPHHPPPPRPSSPATQRHSRHL